jgi:hypothetical protein
MMIRGHGEYDPTMALIEKHVSPDGLLTLIIYRDEQGDISIGFDCFTWHTHAEILAALSGLSEQAAVKHFVDQLLGNRAFIAVARVNNRIRDVWVTRDLAPCKYKPDDETIAFRYWDGTPVLQG